eukprot:TRINITY_DN65584_c0_g1_i1.p2 TRINITY_DN65584_c0_g1~~TRINITY_DN65584_c0_g1_i1.p2  ORF type:complete len:206 (+),score=78.52 TRINITY_DN65584_c0_g1_i1:32-619(+)
MPDQTLQLLGAALFGGAVVYACMREGGKRIEARTAQGSRKAAKRFGGVIKLKPEMHDQYTQLHDHTWDEVLRLMYECNMRNFVVYHHPETNLMFHHWEYVGDDFDADMKRLNEDPGSHFWWSYCEPCQEPMDPSVTVPPSKGGKVWWSPLKLINSCGAWPTAWAAEYPDPDFEPQNPAGKRSTSANPPPVHNRES